MSTSAKREYLGRIGRWSEKVPFIGVKYQVAVLIAKDYGNSTRFELDKAARITTDEGSQVYLLKHANEAMPAVEYKHLYESNSGGKVLFLHSPEKGVYNPVEFDVDGDDLDMSVDQVYWNQWNRLRGMEERNAWENEGSWFQRNQEAVIYMSAGFFFLLVGVGIWFALKDLSGAISQASNTLNAAVESAKSMAGG